MSHIQPDTELPKTPAIRVYTAIISQLLTSDPIIIELHNTIGTITWTRLTDGIYQAENFTQAFKQTKTAMWLNFVNDDVQRFASMNRVSDDQITILTFDIAGPIDSALNQCSIEIRVYQ